MTTVNETITIKTDEGWVIKTVAFMTDPNNHHRKIYPMRVTVNGIELRFLKQTRSGRTMYEAL